MRTYLDCMPCFVQQVLKDSRLFSGDATLHERMVREVLARMTRLPFDRAPAIFGGEIQRMLRAATGVADPYREIKAKYNRLCLDMYPELKRTVAGSKDRFGTAVRIAIAGNIIDFGLAGRMDAGKVRETVAESLTRPFARDGVGELRAAIERARRILYVGDNAGEVVFDRILIEEMPREKVVFAVRGRPILNDATREDAEFAGLANLVRVIDNGSDLPGTVLEECSPDFRAAFESSDLVMAKGQGNYETLSERTAFFLLMVKCRVVAQDAGCTVGDMIVFENKPQARQREEFR